MLRHIQKSVTKRSFPEDFPQLGGRVREGFNLQTCRSSLPTDGRIKEGKNEKKPPNCGNAAHGEPSPVLGLHPCSCLRSQGEESKSWECQRERRGMGRAWNTPPCHGSSSVYVPAGSGTSHSSGSASSPVRMQTWIKGSQPARTHCRFPAQPNPPRPQFPQESPVCGCGDPSISMT